MHDKIESLRVSNSAALNDLDPATPNAFDSHYFSPTYRTTANKNTYISCMKLNQGNDTDGSMSCTYVSNLPEIRGRANPPDGG